MQTDYDLLSGGPFFAQFSLSILVVRIGLLEDSIKKFQFKWMMTDFDAAHDYYIIKIKKYSQFPIESFTFHQKMILDTSHHHISCEFFESQWNEWWKHKSHSSNTRTYEIFVMTSFSLKFEFILLILCFCFFFFSLAFILSHMTTVKRNEKITLAGFGMRKSKREMRPMINEWGGKEPTDRQIPRGEDTKTKHGYIHLIRIWKRMNNIRNIQDKPFRRYIFFCSFLFFIAVCFR